MNVKLISLPQLDALDPKLDPPLGLMYIAAVLESKKIPVEIVDLCFVSKADWHETIGYADVYGITVFTAALSLAQEVYAICKRINPDCIVVAGGPHPTALPNETLSLFDCVMQGEGDTVDFTACQKGLIVQGQKVQMLDELPMPARHLVDLRGYTRRVAGRKATSVIGSRGCPYHCIFCCKDVFGNGVRYHSNERILSEVRQAVEGYGFDAIIFWDDTFTLRRKRLHALCEELGKLNIFFRCNGDTRTDTYEDYQRLYGAGCREICFGIESGSQKILDIIGKGTTVAKNKLAIMDAKRAGINTKAFLMVGSPGESVETVEETKRFLEETEPDQFALYQFVPLPGCAVWKDPDKYDVHIVDRDFRNYYYVSGKIEGGMVIETDMLNLAQIKQLREDLIVYLKQRGQRGELQDWQVANQQVL